jgi:hypothetical protein
MSFFERAHSAGLVDGLVLVGHDLSFFSSSHSSFFITIGCTMWSEYLRMMALELPGRQQVVLAFAQVQGDLGAARGAVDHLDGVGARLVAFRAFPAHALAAARRRRGG